MAQRSRPAIFIVLFLFSFLLYIYTLAPGWGAVNIFNTWDGLEYVLCSSLFGIDHPPGHPFYLLLAKIFSSIFIIGSLAYRMNLFSAFFGALTVAAIYLTVELSLRLIGKPKDQLLSHGAAIVTAVTFAVSKVFWTHSLITEVHSLYLFLMAVSFYLVLRYLEERRKICLYACAAILGLLISTSIFNAVTVLVPIFIFLFVINFSSESDRLSLWDWAKLLFFFVCGGLFYLYYPIASRLNPGFIHPMNLMVSRDPGSLSWFAWYISGKAWTGGGMFSLGRVILGVPNFLRHTIENYTIFALAVFAFALISGCKRIYDHFHLSLKSNFGVKKAIFVSSFEDKIFVLFLFSYIFVAIPQLSLQDVSNPGSTTYIYLANFFLPSFLIYIFLVGIGLGIVLDFIDRSGFPQRIFRIFSEEGSPSESSNRAFILVLLYCLFIMPMYLLATNYKFCNLQGEDTGYRFAKGIVETLPDNSVIYSKLVYQLVGTYFDRIEPSIAKGKIVIENPDLIAKDITFADVASVNPMIEKTRLLKKSINNYLAKSASVYISGDCVDQDKAPEVLLISDLELEPKVPQDLLLSMTKPFPTELIPYEVKALRVGSSFVGSPKIESRGIANNGNFANILELLGYAMAEEKGMGVGRNKISLDFYWRVLDSIPEDLLGVFTVFDERMGRIDPERTAGFFTVGGGYPSSKWGKGQIVKERVYYYLPQLPFGRYYLALGLLKEDGESIPYFPAEYEKYGREFEFILLLPFAIGLQTPFSP